MSKTWFITGASRGLGADIAAAALKAGDNVVATGRQRSAVSDRLGPDGERLLSLALDFDYSELREREYPLLAPAALAARLKMVAEMFPPNPGYQFSVRYRRRA